MKAFTVVCLPKGTHSRQTPFEPGASKVQLVQVLLVKLYYKRYTSLILQYETAITTNRQHSVGHTHTETPKIKH